MSVLPRLKVRASYNILTPIVLLSLAAPMPALAAVYDNNNPTTNVNLDENDVLNNYSSIIADGAHAVSSDNNVLIIDNRENALIQGVGNYRAISIDGNLGRITNSGLIQTGAAAGIVVGGEIGIFENFGFIDAGGSGVQVASGVNNFSNLGGIISDGYGVSIGGNVSSFSTGAGSLDTGISSRLTAISILGSVESFSNNGILNSSEGVGVSISGHVINFDNNYIIATQAQGGGGHGVYLTSVDTLRNNFDSNGVGGIGAANGAGIYVLNGAGTIINNSFIRSGREGIFVGDSANVMANHGTIESDGLGISIGGSLNGFVNSNRIEADDGGVYVQSTLGSFINTGEIKTYDGAGLWTGGNLNAFANTNKIEGVDYGVYVHGQVGDFSNTGTISGLYGIYLDSGGAAIYNSGTITGTGGTAIEFTGDNNTLIVGTGARFNGLVDFNAGFNSYLDATNFHGSITIAVDDLIEGNVRAGNNAYIQANDFVHIFNDDFISHSAQPVTNLVGGINDLIGTKIALGDAITSTDNFVYGYAAQPQSEAEVAAQDMLLDPATTQYWADATGGVGEDGRGVGSVDFYGALIAGAHRQVAPDLKLGALAGAAHTTLSIDGGAQTVDGLVGVVGLYGQRHLGSATLDFSLLGGLSGSDSSREILSGDDTDIAHASFGGWFVTPTVGAYMPVLSTDTGEVSIGGKLGFIGGGFGGYTETGSTANLTVGRQTFGVFSALVEVRGENAINDTVTLNGSLGLFAQHHIGSGVSITLPGSLPAVSPDGAVGTSVGVKAGVGATAQISDALDINAGLNGTWRSNGTVAASANLGIGGKF